MGSVLAAFTISAILLKPGCHSWMWAMSLRCAQEMNVSTSPWIRAERNHVIGDQHTGGSRHARSAGLDTDQPSRRNPEGEIPTRRLKAVLNA